MVKRKAKLSGRAMIDRMRNDARKEAEKQASKHPAGSKTSAERVYQVCLLPWTEYDQQYVPEADHPKRLYLQMEALLESEELSDSSDGIKVRYHMFLPSCRNIIEAESHIIGYFWEVY